MHVISLPYTENACNYFERVRHLDHALLLDSNQPASRFGRYDLVMADPVALITHAAGITTLHESGHCTNSDADPFALIEQTMTRLLPNSISPKWQQLPFCGGAAGLFGYDLGRSIETLPSQAIDDIAIPDMSIGIYLWAIISDYQQQTTCLVSHLSSQLTLALRDSLLTSFSHSRKPFSLLEAFQPNMTPDQYAHKFKRIMDYIVAGDCYQVCLAQRLRAIYQGDLWDAYLRLRTVSPTPFSAYLQLTGATVLSLSPERFLEVNQGQVETKPIKGTRARGQTPQQDKALYNELAASPKDRAENLMIVDLLRNDLSKHCDVNTVQVPRLFAIESYSNVHHLVTTIRGRISDNKRLSLLKGAFPGGSITGAPKLRAMEIIEQLEPHRRTAYTGSIGYISSHGRMDTNICIRTLVATHEQYNHQPAGYIYCWAGGGIVADSNCNDEYQETFDKINNLIHCLQQAS